MPEASSDKEQADFERWKEENPEAAATASRLIADNPGIGESMLELLESFDKQGMSFDEAKAFIRNYIDNPRTKNDNKQ